MKLFDIYKKNEHYKINLLGIKITLRPDNFNFIITLNEKFVILQYIIDSFLCSKFKSRKCNKKKRRLFLTTGNLSLVNAISIIDESDDNYENELLVWSGLASDEFINITSMIAKLGNFKKVHAIFNSINYLKYFCKNNLKGFDEIYLSNQNFFISLVNKLYPFTDLIIFDEALSGIVRRNYFNYKNAKKIIFNKYLKNLDYFGFSHNESQKIEYINKEKWNNIAIKCRNIINDEILNSLGNDKYIIFCGTYMDPYEEISIDELANEQLEIMRLLKNKGFKLIFKPHPRDPVHYKIDDDILIFDTVLPLECYDLHNIVAIVSRQSSTSLQCHNFNNIPGFIYIKQCKKFRVQDKIMLEYTPPLSMLLDLDIKSKSTPEIKMALSTIFEKYAYSKSMLSKNDNVYKFAKDIGYFAGKKVVD